MFHEVQLNSFKCITSLCSRFPLVGPVGAASMQSTNHICLSIPFAARLACVRVCVCEQCKSGRISLQQGHTKARETPTLNAPPRTACCRGIVVRQWGFRIPFSNRLHPHSVVATHSARLPACPPSFVPPCLPLASQLGRKFCASLFRGAQAVARCL